LTEIKVLGIARPFIESIVVLPGARPSRAQQRSRILRPTEFPSALANRIWLRPGTGALRRRFICWFSPPCSPYFVLSRKDQETAKPHRAS